MLRRDPKAHFLRFRDKGDVKALSRLFDATSPELLTLAVHLVRDESAAEDIVQDTFLSAVEAADRFDESRPLMPWLVGILVNRARRVRERFAIERDRNDSSHGGDLEQLALTGETRETDPARTAAIREISDHVSSAVAELSEPYRSVVEEHLHHQRTPKEIAAALGRAPGTVRTQLHRGLTQLRDALTPRGIALESLGALGLGAPVLDGVARASGAGLVRAKEAVLQRGMELARAGAAEPVKSAMGMGAVATTVATLTLAGVGVASLWALSHGTESGDVEPALNRGAELAQPTLAGGTPELELPAAPSPLDPLKEDSLTADRTSLDPGRGKREEVPRRSAAPAAAKKPEPPAFEFSFSARPQISMKQPVLGSINRKVTLEILDLKRNPIVAGSGGRMNAPESVLIGKYPTERDAPFELILRVDHPDAMPAEFASDAVAWRADSLESYVWEPRIRLVPARKVVNVGTGSRALREMGEVSELALIESMQRFRGTVHFLQIHKRGLVLQDRGVIGQYPALSGRALRSDGRRLKHLVVAIPKDEAHHSDLIEVALSNPKEYDLKAALRRRPAPAVALRFVDALGQPVKGAQVAADLDRRNVEYFKEGTEDPFLVDGWAIAQIRDARAAGLRERSGTASQSSLGVMRVAVGGTTDDSGAVVLNGTTALDYKFTVKTDLNEEPVPIFWSRLSSGADDPVTVSAPIGVLSLQLDAAAVGALMGDEDPQVDWTRAKVTIKTKGKTLRAQLREGRATHVRVPPGETLSLTIKPKKGESLEVSVAAIAKGSRRWHFVAPR